MALDVANGPVVSVGPYQLHLVPVVPDSVELADFVHLPHSLLHDLALYSFPLPEHVTCRDRECFFLRFVHISNRVPSERSIGILLSIAIKLVERVAHFLVESPCLFRSNNDVHESILAPDDVEEGLAVFGGEGFSAVQ